MRGTSVINKSKWKNLKQDTFQASDFGESLIMIYTAFVRPRLDYGDILYNQAFNLSFQQKLESIIQNRACLRITGAIRGTSREKIYQELGLESLQSRRWYRKLAMFYKIYKNRSPFYLFNLITEKKSSYATRNVECIPLIKIKSFSKTLSSHLQSLNGTS